MKQPTKSKAIPTIAPNGEQIIGILETLQATAYADVTVSPRTRRFKVQYQGESDMDWNSQVPVKEKGLRLFVDAKHNIWTETQVLEATLQKNGK